MTDRRHAMTDGRAGVAGTPPRRGERILVIEAAAADGAGILASLVSRAAPGKHTVIAAASLREALDCVRTPSIDVAVLDPVLPDADPDTALEKLQATAPALPLLLVVTSSLEEFARDAVCRGAQDYLLKEGLTPKEVEKALWKAGQQRKMEGRLHVFTRAIEQSPVSIVITNTGGEIEYVNPRFTAVTGYSAEEVLGKNPRILKSGLMDPEVYASMWKTLASGGEWRGELHNRKKNGELFWENASISAIRNQRGVVTHYLAVKEDTTAKKNLERQVSRSERMDGIAHALGSIANSFNDLLNNVLGFASLIRKNVADADKTIRYLTTIERSVHRGAELVQRLLTFSASGREAVESLELQPILEESVRKVKERFPAKLTLRTSYGSIDLRIAGDRSSLVQCFTHLLENACEAMLEGPISDNVLTIEIRTLTADGNGGEQAVAVSIADTGTGIPRDLHDTVFEPFFTTKTDRPNRGLGLAVVHTVVRRHRGTISVRSEPGRGTTFTVVLPAAPDTVADRATSTGTNLRGDRELILLVDDEPSMLSFGREVLEEHNYRVLTARDGKEAVDLYRRFTSDIRLVVLDLLMPGMDGGQTYLEMKKINGNLRAFFCTGYTSDAVITSLLAEGQLRALKKPFRVDDFLVTVKEVLEAA